MGIPGRATDHFNRNAVMSYWSWIVPVSLDWCGADGCHICWVVIYCHWQPPFLNRSVLGEFCHTCLFLAFFSVFSPELWHSPPNFPSQFKSSFYSSIWFGFKNSFCRSLLVDLMWPVHFKNHCPIQIIAVNNNSPFCDVFVPCMDSKTSQHQQDPFVRCRYYSRSRNWDQCP